MDVTLVGEDDLDFVLHGMALMAGWSTVVLLGLVKIQLQSSAMTCIQIRQIFTNNIFSSCVYKMCLILQM